MYSVERCCTLLYFAILYSTVIYTVIRLTPTTYVILPSCSPRFPDLYKLTLLYSTLRYCTQLYSAVLYCTVMYYIQANSWMLLPAFLLSFGLLIGLHVKRKEHPVNLYLLGK